MGRWMGRWTEGGWMNSSNREGKGQESWIGLVVCESRDIASLSPLFFFGPSTFRG